MAIVAWMEEYVQRGAVGGLSLLHWETTLLRAVPPEGGGTGLADMKDIAWPESLFSREGNSDTNTPRDHIQGLSMRFPYT